MDDDAHDTPDDELAADLLSDDVDLIDVAPAEVDEVAPIPPESDPVGTARRRHGTAGAVLAAGLFGVDIALGRKPKEEVPVVVDAAGEPTDIDADGIRIPLDDGSHIWAPPPAPKEG